MLICKICGDQLKPGSMGLIHASTGTMYVCAHGKDPRNCPCGKDDHCVQPVEGKPGLHDCSDNPFCDCGL